MNELEILREVLPLLPQNNDTLVGPGDDCAVVRVGEAWQLLAVDQVIAGVHYDPAVTLPARVAAKLLKRNLSDIAAMGGIPEYALLTLAGNIQSDDWYREFFRALADCARQYNVAVSGGDLASLPPGCPPESMVATLTITGRVVPAKLCLRKNAAPGQTVFVTGEFGNSYHSEHHLDFTPRLAEADFLSGRFTDCMIDVSDGFLLDLGRVATASGMGVEIDPAALPRRAGADLAGALGDGEDYELIFTVPDQRIEMLYRQWPFPTRLTDVGHIVADHPGLVFDWDGANLSAMYSSGFKHLGSK